MRPLERTARGRQFIVGSDKSSQEFSYNMPPDSPLELPHGQPEFAAAALLSHLTDTPGSNVKPEAGGAQQRRVYCGTLGFSFLARNYSLP